MTNRINQTRGAGTRELVEGAIAPSTTRAYRKAWDKWEKYCIGRGVAVESASPRLIAEFLTSLAKKPSKRRPAPVSMNTIRIYLAGIKHHYSLLTDRSPAESKLVSNTMRAIARKKALEPERRVHALREDEITAMLRFCDFRDIRGYRDMAIISVGFACALRRSEICNLAVEDVEVMDEGGRAIIHIRKSKTDQFGSGHKIAAIDGVTIRPVEKIRKWLFHSEIKTGTLFRSFSPQGKITNRGMDESYIPKLLKSYAKRAGMDPAEISGHSLRAGFITSAAAHGARPDKIMDVSRHTNIQTLMRYVRDADAFSEHAGRDFL